MKKYINAATSNGKYIGGKLYDLPDDYWEDEDAHIDRFELQNAYINNFNHGYYILYRPDSDYNKFELLGGMDLLVDISDGMRIKDGIDVIAYKDHIDLVGYYNGSKDIVEMYPISITRAIELSSIIDDSDFDETTTIENEIAQYAWNGASVEDILKSWNK